MKIKVVGQIGETNSFFDLPLKEVKAIEMDLSEMTYISSVGVKNWIIWSMRFPKGTKATLHHCPFVIVSQASTVEGFANPDRFFIASFQAPFACEECGTEKSELLQLKVHYDYTSPERAGWFNPPADLKCSKCSSPLEPDFFVEKVLKILNKT